MSALLELYDRITLDVWRRRSAALNAWCTAPDADLAGHWEEFRAAHDEATELQRQLAAMPATTPEEERAKRLARPDPIPRWRENLLPVENAHV